MSLPHSEQMFSPGRSSVLGVAWEEERPEEEEEEEGRGAGWSCDGASSGEHSHTPSHTGSEWYLQGMPR